MTAFGNQASRRRTAAPVARVETVEDACFYCKKPIGDAPRVSGAKADAHRTCVRTRLDSELSEVAPIRSTDSSAEEGAQP